MKKNYIEKSHHDAEFEARVGKVIKEFSNEQETISIEELESWVEMDNMKRRSKRKRVMSVAACFILICGFSLSMRYYVNMDDPIAVAGGGDQPVVINGTFGSSEEVHTTWETVLETMERYPDMLVPEYVPEGYKFKELKVKSTNVGQAFEFSYANSEGQMLHIKEMAEISDTVILDYDKKISWKSGDAYLKYEKQTITATSVIKNIRVSVTSTESENEFMAIMNALKSGS